MSQQKISQQNKAGQIIILIGRQHSGKSPIAKRLAENSSYKNKIVLDLRKEYPADRFTVFYSKEKFKELLVWIKNSFIIIEECTTFISAYKNMDFAEVAAAVEHNNNTVIFIFHSVADTPKYLLRLARYVILLPTNDDKELVKRSHPKLHPYLGRDEDVYLDWYKIK